MLQAIRKAAPKDDSGQNLASHYQLATLHAPSEDNRRGAGRPSWMPALPLSEPPDALPGLYLIRYLAQQGQDLRELCRAEIALSLGQAQPPAPAASAPAARQAPDPGTQPAQALLHAASETYGHQQALNQSVRLDAQQQLEAVLRQVEKEREYLARERERGDRLQERLDRVLLEKLQLIEVLTEKLQAFAATVAAVPQPPGELPYVSALKAVFEGLAPFAPGVNAALARVGQPQGQPALPPHEGPAVRLVDDLVLLLTAEPAAKVAAHRPMGQLLQQLAPGAFLVLDADRLEAELKALGLELPPPTRAPRPAPAEPPAPAAAPGPAPATGAAPNGVSSTAVDSAAAPLVEAELV